MLDFERYLGGKSNRGVWQRPTLHLIAGGTGLLLKYPIVMAGKSAKAVGDKYGHRLSELWKAPENFAL